MGPQVLGGPCILPLFRTIIECRGVSFAQHSVGTTFQQEPCIVPYDNVYEYIRKFNYVAQYGTHHVDTDEKKAKLFRRGLSLPLQDRLV
jgi:hypothetical protein